MREFLDDEDDGEEGLSNHSVESEEEEEEDKVIMTRSRSSGNLDYHANGLDNGNDDDEEEETAESNSSRSQPEDHIIATRSRTSRFNGSDADDQMFAAPLPAPQQSTSARRSYFARAAAIFTRQ